MLRFDFHRQKDTIILVCRLTLPNICGLHNIIQAKLGAAASVVRSGVDVVVAKCGSDSAKIAMSDGILRTNSQNNTLIRLYENQI